MDDGQRRSGGCGLVAVMALLVLAGLFGLGGYVWIANRSTVVSSYIQVNAPDGAAAADVNRHAANVIALLGSPVVARKALAKPTIAKLPTVAGQTDSTTWLVERLQVKQFSNSEVVQLLLEGESAFDDVKIMVAIIETAQAVLATQPDGRDAIKVIQVPIAIKQ